MITSFVFDISEDLGINTIYFVLLLPETFNSLIRIAAVSSDGDKSRTQLALGLLREMLALGIGNFGYVYH